MFKITLSALITTLIMTSTLAATGPALAFTTTGAESSIPAAAPNPRSTSDTSKYYSSPPRASESSIATVNEMASLAAENEFQITQDLAEYRFVERFAPNEVFGNPDITIDQSNNDDVYVADYFNNRVIKFDSSGSVIDEWGMQGSGNGQFINPQDVGLDSSGFVYVVDTRNHRIQKFTSTGQYVDQWGSQGSTDGQFNFPDRIAIDSNDFIYVTDDGNGRVQKFTTGGQFVDKFGENYLNVPVGIGVDSMDNVYVAESGGNRVSKFTSTGQLITAWGSSGSGDGQFNQPKGLHVDSQDNVFVADEHNNRVQVFDKDGNLITGFNVMNGFPIDVGVDSIDRVFVSRAGNEILIYELVVPTPTIPELIDIINGLGVTSSTALIQPLQHMCKDISMYLSKVDSYERTGKLTLEQAEELRQLGTTLQNELAC